MIDSADRRPLRTPGLVVGAALLAVILLPWPAASWFVPSPWTSAGTLARAVTDALVQDWRSGVTSPGTPGSALARPTQFWQAFHLVKTACAIALLVTSLLAASRIRTATTPIKRGSRRLVASLVSQAGVGIAVLGLLITVANLQGALAPLSSVLGFLPQGASPELSQAVVSLRDGLTNGTPAPLGAAVLADFGRYHLVMAVLGALATAALAWFAVVAWRRGGPVAGIVLGLGAICFAVVTAANLGTALDPAPALDAFLAGVASR